MAEIKTSELVSLSEQFFEAAIAIMDNGGKEFGDRLEAAIDNGGFSDSEIEHAVRVCFFSSEEILTAADAAALIFNKVAYDEEIKTALPSEAADADVADAFEERGHKNMAQLCRKAASC